MEPTSATGGPGESCVYADEEHAICVLGNVVLSYSLNAPNSRYLKAWARTMDQREPPILALIVIDSGARAPDAAAKESITQTIKRHERGIVAFGYVVEGQGFAAAAIRGALSVILLATRYPFPLRVMATAEEAAPWLLQHLPPDARRNNEKKRIIQALDAIRLQLRRDAAVPG